MGFSSNIVFNKVPGLNFFYLICLEDTEGFLSSLSVNSGFTRHHVESDSLGKWTALSDGNNVTILDIECGAAMNGNILVPLLESPVFRDEVKVIPSYNNSALHLGGDDESFQDAATDGDIACEGALLVHVCSLDGGIGCLDSKSHVTSVTHGFLALVSDGALACHENSILRLVGLFVLITFLVFSCEACHCRDSASFLCTTRIILQSLRTFSFTY
mmetsp:Transcript_22296/g.31386  ORF Transcript_22296/g.31386 Transcript_22296/m.31386 type:complete len:215 (+) Transcript_22296:123-767(+)